MGTRATKWPSRYIEYVQFLDKGMSTQFLVRSTKKGKSDMFIVNVYCFSIMRSIAEKRIIPIRTYIERDSYETLIHKIQNNRALLRRCAIVLCLYICFSRERYVDTISSAIEKERKIFVYRCTKH